MHTYNAAIKASQHASGAENADLYSKQDMDTQIKGKFPFIF